MTRMPAAPSRVIALITGALLLAGCTATPSTDPGPSRTPLELTIGTLLPQTAALAAFGPAALAGATLAAADVNDAGAGLTVTLESRDSGDATSDLSLTSVDELLDLDVSVIVGAISDNVSRKVIDTIVDARVVQISPGNTSTDFSRFTDDLYWRTAPSCTLEGDAMGKVIADDKVKTLGIIYEAKACEPGLPEALAESFERAGGQVVVESPFDTGATSLSAQVAEVVAAKPDAVAIVTRTSAQLAVPELSAAGFDGSELYFVGLPIADHSTDFPAGSLTGARASLPGIDITNLDDFTDRLLDIDPTLTDFSYAAETYDAVILASLAALAARGTTGEAIASKLQEVSGGSGEGTRATDFAAAAKLILAGDSVDYDGPSGAITFDKNGDPSEAVIGIYRYGANNTFTRLD